MPINPSIALSGKPLELANPLESYARVAQIQQAQQQNALAQYQLQKAQRDDEQTRALNALYAGAVTPEGKVDYNKLIQGMSASGQGALIPGALKDRRAYEEAESKALKAKIDLQDVRLKQSRQLLEGLDPNDPKSADAYIAWHEANHADPILGPMLAERGITADQSRARIQQALQTPGGLQRLIYESKLGMEKFIEANKPTTQVINRSGQSDVIQIPGLGGAPTTVGTYADVPLPPEVQAQKVRTAEAGSTKVINAGQTSYAQTIGKGAGESDLALHATITAAPEMVRKIDETLDILRNQDINTGLGAELFTVLDKAKAQFLADKNSGKRVTSTEYLDSLLGSEVFPQIQALGIGARGMDTPAEREFLRKVMTGSITLDRGTLVKMAELRRKSVETAVERYNERVDKGELDAFFQHSNRVKSKVTLPEAPKADATKPAARTVVKTGRDASGRRVVQYSDGTIDYAPN